MKSKTTETKPVKIIVDFLNVRQGDDENIGLNDFRLLGGYTFDEKSFADALIRFSDKSTFDQHVEMDYIDANTRRYPESKTNNFLYRLGRFLDLSKGINFQECTQFTNSLFQIIYKFDQHKRDDAINQINNANPTTINKLIESVIDSAQDAVTKTQQPEKQNIGENKNPAENSFSTTNVVKNSNRDSSPGFGLTPGPVAQAKPQSNITGLEAASNNTQTTTSTSTNAFIPQPVTITSTIANFVLPTQINKGLTNTDDKATPSNIFNAGGRPTSKGNIPSVARTKHPQKQQTDSKQNSASTAEANEDLFAVLTGETDKGWKFFYDKKDNFRTYYYNRLNLPHQPNTPISEVKVNRLLEVLLDTDELFKNSTEVTNELSTILTEAGRRDYFEKMLKSDAKRVIRNFLNEGQHTIDLDDFETIAEEEEEDNPSNLNEFVHALNSFKNDPISKTNDTDRINFQKNILKPFLDLFSQSFDFDAANDFDKNLFRIIHEFTQQQRDVVLKSIYSQLDDNPTSAFEAIYKVISNITMLGVESENHDNRGLDDKEDGSTYYSSYDSSPEAQPSKSLRETSCFEQGPSGLKVLKSDPKHTDVTFYRPTYDDEQIAATSGGKFDFSRDNDSSRKPEMKSAEDFKKFIHWALRSAYVNTRHNPEIEPLKGDSFYPDLYLAIAIDVGGVGRKETEFKKKLAEINKEWSLQQIDTHFKQAKAFSAEFQELTRKHGYFTGNQNCPKDITEVGMRLKRVTPDFIFSAFDLGPDNQNFFEDNFPNLMTKNVPSVDVKVTNSRLPHNKSTQDSKLK